jgi:hypothetical protein
MLKRNSTPVMLLRDENRRAKVEASLIQIVRDSSTTLGMTKDASNAAAFSKSRSDHGKRGRLAGKKNFVLSHSFVIRHSCFVIHHVLITH